MQNLDTNREPLCDFGLEDLILLQEYKRKINATNYSSAVKILDDRNCNKGLRASIFQSIKNRILDLELYLLNLTADKDTIYSLNEPNDEQMASKTFWIQPVITDKNLSGGLL